MSSIHHVLDFFQGLGIPLLGYTTADSDPSLSSSYFTSHFLEHLPSYFPYCLFIPIQGHPLVFVKTISSVGGGGRVVLGGSRCRC